MASSLLALGDLINYQLERLNLDELMYKDELQLQRQLIELDQTQQQQSQQSEDEHKLSYTYARKQKQRYYQYQQQQQLQQKSYHHQIIQIPPDDPTTTTTTSDSQPFEARDLESGGGGVSEVYTEDELGAVGGAAAFATATTSATGSDDDASNDLQMDFKTQVLEWFQQLHVQTESFKSDEESRRVREAGNNIYRKEHHSLKACDYYTEAIFLAPTEDTDSLAAAMAHANRSTVLHDFGMYKQAYDDCVCALELGYPEEYYPIVKLIQANCALQLKNFTLCELHLHELLHMELTEVFEGRTHEIWHECEVLKAEKIEMGVQTDDNLHGNDSKVYEVAWNDTCRNMKTNKSAFMRAIADIPSNAPIFCEDAAVFVPSARGRICDNCAITQFIPFPCIYCSNRTAVYCSRKCRAQHASIHVLECFAHQIELFEEFAKEFYKARLLQLAFRMLIIGLPQVMPHCRKKPTVNKMWAAFNGILTERHDIPYSALLRLETHMDKSDAETMVSFAVIAHIMAIYLAECTDFFEHLDFMMPATTKLSRNEWILLSAALLLRHICQLHKNLIYCPSFVLPADPHILSPMDEYSVWASVNHVRQGQLHLLTGDVDKVAYAVFPETLSVCKHSCNSTFYRKFSAKKLTAFATSSVSAGAIIYNCFSSGNYRQSSHRMRRHELNEKGIDCKCDKCFRPNPDEDFHKFHRYRCDNPNCMQIFTPSTSKLSSPSSKTDLKCTQNLRWWESKFYTCPESIGTDILECTICEETQKLEWFWTFNSTLLDCDSIEVRCKLYAAIDRAETQLVETHECKVALARQLVEQCLLKHRGQKPLDEWEFNKLGSIMRSALHIVAAQYSVFSIEYVQHMSYFWDIMALSNYKCNDKELMQMLHALEYIPDEFKEIFINYYEDFITPKFAEETYTTLMDTQV